MMAEPGRHRRTGGTPAPHSGGGAAWWQDRANTAAWYGEPLRVTPVGYAELVALKLCSEPADPDEHDRYLFGVPLVVEQ